MCEQSVTLSHCLLSFLLSPPPPPSPSFPLSSLLFSFARIVWPQHQGSNTDTPLVRCHHISWVPPWSLSGSGINSCQVSATRCYSSLCWGMSHLPGTISSTWLGSFSGECHLVPGVLSLKSKHQSQPRFLQKYTEGLSRPVGLCFLTVTPKTVARVLIY